MAVPASPLLACMICHVKVSFPWAGGMWIPLPAPKLMPCSLFPDLEQLYLGLYGTSDRLTLAKEGSYLLTRKWCHALRELDLSGQGFSEKDLEEALAAFSVTPGGSHPALCSLNLRGTRVTPSTVRSASLPSVPGIDMACLPDKPAWFGSFRGRKGEQIGAKPLLGVGLRDTKGTGFGPQWLWVTKPVVHGQRGLFALA